MKADSSDIRRKKTRLSMARHRRKLKERAIEYKGGKCESCGYSKCLTSLHFHHTDPLQKEFAIGTRTKSNWENVRNELDKCTLICANCHGELHDSEFLTSLKILEEETCIKPKEYGTTCIVCKSKFDSGTSKARKCPLCKKTAKSIQIENLEQIAKKQTAIAIAKQYNCHPSTVNKLCDKAGIQRPIHLVDKIQWPSDEELSKLVMEKPLTKLSKDLGVSDNAIRKRCNKNGIQLPPRGFWLR
jgi:hypothetical protein